MSAIVSGLFKKNSRYRIYREGGKTGRKIIAFPSSRLFLITILLAACTNTRQDKLPYYNTTDFTPYWINDEKEAMRKIDHKVGNFSFTDQEGNTIGSATVKGKIHVANFFFSTCPGICPKMMTNLRQVQNTFATNNDVILLSYSVTPWIDSITRLKKYAEKNKINSRQWHLLTGSTQAIYSLARKEYFAEEATGFNKDSTEFLHTEHFILVDRNDRIRGIYNGTLILETERLIEDISLLLKEKQ